VIVHKFARYIISG